MVRFVLNVVRFVLAAVRYGRGPFCPWSVMSLILLFEGQSAASRVNLGKLFHQVDFTVMHDLRLHKYCHATLKYFINSVYVKLLQLLFIFYVRCIKFEFEQEVTRL